MEDFFEKLKCEVDAKFQKNEKKWFNGSAYFPLISYNIQYKYLIGEIKINYEFRQSEFSKPKGFEGGLFGNRHNCLLICNILVDKKHPNFSISERGIFAKLFKKKSTLVYKVNCKEKGLTQMLENNKSLGRIFKIVENSPEFSPSINGKMDKDNYKLNIIYSTQQNNESVLILMNEFCRTIIEFFNK